MAALPKVARYIKNVGQSVVYASVDNIKEDMPNIAAIVDHESNKEVYKSIYQGIRDYKTTYSRAVKFVKSTKLYEAGTIAKNAAIEDIKSGKFYNKQRMAEIEDRVGAQMGYSLDDLEGGFDIDEGSSDMDFGAEDDITEGDNMIAGATMVASMKNAEMISNTIIKTSEAQMKHTEASTNLLYSQNFKLFGELRTDLANFSTRGIQETVKTNTLLTTMADNQKKFYETATKSLQDIAGYLKESTEMSRNLYGQRQQESEKPSNKITITDLIDSNGVLDLKEYGKLIARNTKNVVSEKTGGMLDMLNMGGDNVNMLAMFAANPLGEVMKMGLRGAMSKSLRKSMKDLDKTLGGVAATALARFTNMGKNDDWDANPLFKTIGQIFGVNTSVKSSLDPGKFEKGPVPFDGITRATINNAITGYLSRIEAALTGGPVRVYNPQTGKWTNARGLKKDYDSMKKSAISSGTSDMAELMANYIYNDKKYRARSIGDRQRIEESFNGFINALYEKNGDFKLKSWDDYSDWGVASKDMFQLIAGAYVNASKNARGTRFGSAGSVMDAKASLNRRMEDLEKNNSIYNLLFSGAFDAKDLKYDQKYEEAPTTGLAVNVATFKDNKGHDMYFYLQNILDEVYRLRNASGGGGGVFNGLHYGNGKQFKELPSNIKNDHKQTEKEKYYASQASANTRYMEEIDKFIENGGTVYDLMEGGKLKAMMENLSEEERIKIRQRLMDSENAFQRAMYRQHFTVEDLNAKREAQNKDPLTGGVVNRFKQATLTEKLQMAVGALNKAAAAPSKTAEDLITKADERIYEFFYGTETGEVDEEGNKIKGFMQLMSTRLNTEINKMTDFFEKHLFGKIKEKLGINEWGELIDKLGIKERLKNAKEGIFGRYDETTKTRSGGIFGDYIQNIKDTLKAADEKATEWIKDSFKSVTQPLRDKFKSKPTETEYRAEDFDADQYSTPVKPQNTYIKDFSKDKIGTIEKLKQDIYTDLSALKVPGAKSILDCKTSKDAEAFKVSVEKILNSRTFKKRKGVNDRQSEFIIININLLIKLYKSLERYKQSSLAVAGKTNLTALSNSEKAEKARETAVKTNRDRQAEANTFRSNYAENTEAIHKSNLEQDKKDFYRNQKIEADKLKDTRLAGDHRGSALDPLSGPIEKICKQLRIKSSSKEAEAIRIIVYDLVLNDPNYDAKHPGRLLNNLGVSAIYNELAKKGMTSAANKIEKIILDDFGNRDVTVSDFMKTDLEKTRQANRNMMNGVLNTSTDTNFFEKMFNKVNDTLKKILKVLAAANGVEVVDKGDSTEVKIDTTGNTSNIIQRIFGSGRESETEADSTGSEEPPRAAFGGYFAKAGTSALSKDEIYGRNGLYGKVPQTGVYNVKAGTTIYPTNKDKAIELAGEQKAIDKYIQSNAEANNAETMKVNGKTYIKRKIDGVERWAREEAGKWYVLNEENIIDVKEFGKQVADTAASAIGQVKAAYKGEVYTGVKIDNKNAKQLAAEIRQAAPEITVGTALGAAAGLLVGNPMLGAALGGAMTMTSASETAKTWLFGEQIKDAEGNVTGRKGGAIPKSVQDAFNKYAPDMAKHATVGGLLGLVTPFGLVGGALLGAAAGYVKTNEDAKLMLFGDATDPNSGIISKNARDKLKKIAPNLAVGALAGIFTGPFGLVGNAVLGSGLGFLSTTEHFKTTILGEPLKIGPNGEEVRVGGLVGVIRDDIIEPIKDWGANFVEKTQEFLSDKVFKPLADSFQPIVHEIARVGKGFGKFIENSIETILNNQFGKTLGSWVHGFLRPVKGVAGAASKVAGTVAKGTILAPVTAISALGTQLRRNQIARGDANYMTAQERLDYRANAKGGILGKIGLGIQGNGDLSAVFRKDTSIETDKTLASLDDKGLEAAQEYVRILSANKGFYQKSLNQKSRAISTLLGAYFDGFTLRKMRNLCKKNQWQSVLDMINTATPKDITKFDTETKKALMEKVSTLMAEYSKAQAAKNADENVRADALKKLRSMGFTNVTESNLENLYAGISKERDLTKAKDAAKTEDEKNRENANENTDKIIKALEELKTAVLMTKETSKELNGKTYIKTVDPQTGKEKWVTKDKYLESKGVKTPKVEVDTYERKGKIYRRTVDANGNTRWVSEDKTNENISLRGIDDFNGRLRDKSKSDDYREYYDADANTVRTFKKTLTGWKEVKSKASQDADRQEDKEQESQSGFIARALSKMPFFGKKSKNDEEGEEKEGFLSKLLKGGSKLLKLLGPAALTVTAAAGAGHLGNFLETKGIPFIKEAWTNKVQPWLEEKIGTKLDAVVEGIRNIPTMVGNAFKSAIQWIGDNAGKVLTWYTDGIKYFGGYVQKGLSFLVSNLPTILWAFGKNIVLPGIKGIFEGVASWFGQKEQKSYKDAVSPKASSVSFAESNKVVTEANAAASRLGIKSSFNTDNDITLEIEKSVASSGGDTGLVTKEQAAIYNDLQARYDAATTDAERAAILEEAHKNAYVGQVVTDDGKIIDYHDNSIMIKDKNGNTMEVDEDGNIINSQDQAGKYDFGKKLKGRIARAMLTGNKGIMGLGLKASGTALRGGGRLLKAFGKAASKIPTGGLVGAGSKLVGTTSSIVGSGVKLAGKAFDAMPTTKSVANALTNSGATATKAQNLILSIISKLYDIIEGALSNKYVAKLLDGAFKLVKSEKTAASVSEDFFNKMVEVADAIKGKLTTAATGTGAAGFATKAAKILNKVAIVVSIATAIKDFLEGYDNAEGILGVIEEETDYTISIPQKICCGLIQMINGFLLGLIDESVIADVIIDKILPFFKIDTAELDAARKQSEEFIAQLNATGDNYDVYSYTTKDKWTTKFKTAVKGIFGKGFDMVKDTATDFIGKGIDVGKTVLSGDIKGLFTGLTDFKDDDGNTSFGRMLGSAVESAMMPVLAVPTAVIGGVKWVSKNIGNIVDTIKTEGSAAVDKIKGTTSYIFNGDVKGLVTSVGDIKTEEGNLSVGKLIGSTLTGSTLPFTIIPTCVIGAVRSIGKGIKTIYDTAINLGSHMNADDINIAKLAKAGNFKGFMAYTTDVSEDDSFATIRTANVLMHKVLRSPQALLNNIKVNIGSIFKTAKEVSIKDILSKAKEYTDLDKHPTMDGFDTIYKVENDDSPLSAMAEISGKLVVNIAKPIINIIRSVKSLGLSIGDWVDEKKAGAKEVVNTAIGTVKSAFGFGSGRAYQKDPRYANIPFNRNGDRSRQTIGDSGCGPAAAVNAVNYAYGTGNDLITAANTAKGYKELDGGTKPQFFDRYFRDNGLKANRLSGAGIEDSLRSGNPVVLMGKDSRGGVNTPYGPNPHYITAKGIDRNGNIIIDDPENPNSTAIYNKNRVLGHSSIAIGASKYGRGRWGKGPTDTEENKQIIWSFLKSKGYNDIAASAIMGNIAQECSYDYALTEKGGSGPGVGICQWTYSTRKNAFLSAVPDWRNNLMGQLDFMWNEINSSYKKVLPENLNKATTVNEAVGIFHDVYEQSNDRKAFGNLSKRENYASQAYSQFTGSTPVNLPAYTTSGYTGTTTTNNTTTSSSSTLGQLGQALSGLFKSALAAEYGDTAFGAIFGSGSANRAKYGMARETSSINMGDFKRQEYEQLATLPTTGEKNMAGFMAIGWIDKPYEQMIMKGDASVSALNIIAKKTGKSVSIEDGKKTVKTVLKKYYGIDMASLKSFADKIAPYANSSLQNLQNENSALYYQLKTYAKHVGLDIGTRKNFESLTVQQVCARLGLSIKGEKVEGATYATIESTLGSDTGAAPQAGSTTYSTEASISTSSSGGIGSIFDIIKSAFYSAFDYTDKNTGEKKNLLSILGLGGSSSTSTDSTYTTTDGYCAAYGGIAPAGLSQAQTNVYNKITSIIGKNEYTQSASRDQVGATLNGASKGYGDCSSTVRWALKTGAGVDPGSYTGAQIDSSLGKWVDGPYEIGSNVAPNASALAVGDLMFYGKPTSSNSRHVSHVEMYYGDNKRIGHGSDMGPKVSNYTDKSSTQTYLGAKRFIEVGGNTTLAQMSIPEDDIDNYGTGSANVAKGYVASTFNDPTRASHNGVDIAASKGEPVISNVNGEVIRSEYNETNGNMVVIRDGQGRLHTFEHLLAPGPKAGTRISSGSIIGYVGSTGRSSGNHVHMSVTDKNGQFVDPMTKKPAANTRPIGGDAGIDYTSLIKAVIEVLVTIADNTSKVDKLISILTGMADNTGTQPTVTPITANDTSVRDKLAKVLGSSNYSSMLKTDNVSNIVNMMSKIAVD